MPTVHETMHFIRGVSLGRARTHGLHVMQTEGRVELRSASGNYAMLDAVGARELINTLEGFLSRQEASQ